ncbi:MAG TPA: LptF/LptG family permease [Turneriella sp.]|nr:LptF/LptG family permease [Turneriella sp.]
MDILDRYIFKSFIKTFLGTLLLLFGLAIIVKIIDSLKMFTDNKHGAWLLVKYYIVVSPSFVTFIVPPALMFAIAFSVAQFNRHFELTVIMTAGRSFKRILRPMLIFSIFLSVAFFLFNEYVAYPASYKAVNISYILRDRGADARLKKSDKSSDLTLRFGNRYYTIGNGLWYESRLIGFHLVEMTPQGTIARIISADAASVSAENSHSWSLKNVEITLFNEQGAYVGMETFDAQQIELPETLRSFRNFYIETDPDERSIFEAYQLYRNRKELGGSYREFLTETVWHAGYPLICIFIVFLGGMTGGKLKKASAATSIAASMLFTLFYFFLMYFGTAFGESGTLPPLIAGNLANFVAAGGAIWIHYKIDF